MRKLTKIMLFMSAMIGICLFQNNAVAAKAEELPQEQSMKDSVQEAETTVAVEGIEFASDEEALAYLAETYELELPYAMEIEASAYITISGNVITVSFSTTSSIGTASSIGIKNVYIQYKTPGSDMVGNHVPSGTYTTTNSSSFNNSYSYSTLEKGYQYRGKQTHFIVVKGVEYTYTTYTNYVSYYC